MKIQCNRLLSMKLQCGRTTLCRQKIEISKQKSYVLSGYTENEKNRGKHSFARRNQKSAICSPVL